jgi:hypothetical protein
MCGTISCVCVIVAGHVGVEHRAPAVEIGVLDGLRKRAVHECAVHERVDPAEALDRLRRELPALRALGDVGAQLQHVACDAASGQPALAVPCHTSSDVVERSGTVVIFPNIWAYSG